MLAGCVVFRDWDSDISARTQNNTVTLLIATINHSPFIRDTDCSEKIEPLQAQGDGNRAEIMRSG